MRSMENNISKTAKASPLQVVVPYLIVSILWIYFSDKVVSALVTEIVLLSKIQTFKGIAFVLINGVLLYFLSRNNIRLVSKSYRDKIEKDRIYKLLLERSTDLTLLLDDEGNNKYAPDNLQTILGYTETEFKSVNLFELIYPEDREKMSAILQEVINNPEHLVHAEYRVTNKFGEIIWVESVFKNHLNDPLIAGIIVNNRDITARVHTVEILHKNELQFRSIFEQALVGMAIVDVVTGKKIVNDQLIRLTGYPREVITMHDPAISVAPQDRAKYREIWGAVERGERDGFDIEIHFQHKDGRVFWVNQTMQTIRDFNDKPAYLSVITRDIDDKKQSKADLEYKNKELDTFIYRSSHDLRGPIATLLGLVDVAKSETSDPEAQVYFDHFNVEALRLEKILSNLMAVTMIKQNEVCPRKLNLHDLIEKLVYDLKITDPSCAVFILDINPALTIKSDETLLKTTLNAILENAVHFRGAHTVPNEIVISGAIAGELVHLSIRDNGSGVAPEELDKVFDLFFRGKKTQRGSGIGLYVARNAVEKLHGRISLESLPTLGTEVHIALPC